MGNFVYEILDFWLFLNKIFLEFKYKVKFDNKSSYTNSTSKKIIMGDEIFDINAQTEENRKKTEAKIAKIVKKNLKTPEKLLNFIENNGTKVYRISNADIILNFIGEDEGFICELKGLKAFYLNFLVKLINEKRISIKFKTEPMFVLRNMPLETYCMIHQFYIWFSYKIKLPGYDYETQKKFKTVLKTLSSKEINKLNIEEIVSIKEAIKRDEEAINFVLNLSKETSASKKLLEKIIKGESVKI